MLSHHTDLLPIVSVRGRLRQSYFEHNHPALLVDILAYTAHLVNLSFAERAYYYQHGITKLVCCRVCGVNPVSLISFQEGYRLACSNKSCAQSTPQSKDKRVKTNQERYGVSNPMLVDEFKERLFTTNLERYGHRSSAVHEDVIAKRKATTLEKHGVENALSSPKIREKVRKTTQERYGVDSYTQTEEYRAKTKATNQAKFGVDYYPQSEEYKNRVNTTNMGKYGHNWYAGSLLHQRKIVAHNLSNFGAKYLFQSNQFIHDSKFRKANEKAKRYLERGYELVEAETLGFVTLHAQSCTHTFRISEQLFNRRRRDQETVCSVCNPFNQQHSKGELALREWVKTKLGGTRIVERDRQTIKPYELDILMPDKYLAVEYNGLYYHSELFLSTTAHLEKTRNCRKQGVELLHVWEDDWMDKNAIITSIIATRCGAPRRVVYGRTCIIQEVGSREANVFLTHNHLQGAAVAKYRYGLYQQGELLALMTFGQRKFLNKKEEGFELVRLCTKLETVVVGGATRLWKHFLRQQHPNRVVSYCDLSLFTGAIYTTLGFVHHHDSEPGYQWVIQGKRHHRYNFTKQKLVAAGADPALTEVEIMHDRGAFRVYDCGQAFYEWVAVK